MNALPNIISSSRGVAALAMLFFPVFSTGFWMLYCWGGISDMVDGAVARRLRSVSEIGSSRQRKLTIQHSMSNRLAGILLFCLPFAIVRFDALIPAVIVCSIATICLFEDFHITGK